MIKSRIVFHFIAADQGDAGAANQRENQKHPAAVGNGQPRATQATFGRAYENPSAAEYRHKSHTPANERPPMPDPIAPNFAHRTANLRIGQSLNRNPI